MASGAGAGEDQASCSRLGFPPVLPLLLEAEAAVWQRGEHGNHGENCHNDEVCPHNEVVDSVHTALLRHGRCVVNIHRYFSNLQSRKCCLNLAAAQTTFSNLRLVSQNQDDVGDDGSLGCACVQSPFVDKLSEQDLEVYGQALLCALFPVLGVPALPADTPTPACVQSAARRQANPDPESHLPMTLECDEMTSVIPPETLCDLLRSAFNLSHQRAAKYERLVLGPYKKKTHARVLVEELASQFSQMENDKHAYYTPRYFLTRWAYDQWKHQQRRHLGALISKFWYDALPPLKPAAGPDMTQHHTQYRQLLSKLMMYEASLRGEDIVSVLSAPLSSASRRLLQEFGLRYGVGEMTRQAVYLAYLSDHFETEVWFIRHVNSQLVAILHAFPASRTRVIMVHEEYNMLYKSAMTLHDCCQYALTRMTSLFTGQQPAEGIGCLIELLTNVLELKAYLLDKHQNPVKDFLITYIKMNVSNLYKRHKTVAMADLKLDHCSVPTPALLSRLIAAMRDDLNEYAANYCRVFTRYFDLVALCTQCFYIHLMDDVAILSDDVGDANLRSELDLRLLSLAYRLSQLDKDWKHHIPLRYQTWRRAFRPVVLQWLSVLGSHCERLTMQTVGADKFTGLELHEVSLQSPLSSRPPSAGAASLTSLTPSEGSAFDPVTPKGSKQSPRDSAIPSLRDWLTSSMQLEGSASFTPHDLTLAQSKHQPNPRGDRHTSSQPQANNKKDMTETSFSQHVTETSFTYRRRPTFLFDEDMQVMNPNMDNPDIHESCIETAECGTNTQNDVTKSSLKDTAPHGKLNGEKTESTQLEQDTKAVNLQCPADGAVNLHRPADGAVHLQQPAAGAVHPQQPADGAVHPQQPADGAVHPQQPTDGVIHLQQPADLCVNQKPADQEGVLVNVPSAPSLVIDEESVTENKDIGLLEPSQQVHDLQQDDRHTTRQRTDWQLSVSEDPNLLTVSLECNAKSLCDSFKHDEVMAFLSDSKESQNIEKSSVTDKNDKFTSAVLAKPLGQTSNADMATDHPFSMREDATPGGLESGLDENNRDHVEEEIKGTNDNQTRSPDSPTTSDPASHPSISESLLSFTGVLPVSGSVVDMTALLQRLVSFSRVLADTLYPAPEEYDNNLKGGVPAEWLALQEEAETLEDMEAAARVYSVRARTQIYEIITQIVCSVVCQYANNLLCYDLCGTREHEATRLIGSQLLRQVKEEHREGKVWGCRHMAHGEKSCFLFVDRKTRYLADRYEPVSEKMAHRLNNVTSLLNILPQVESDVDSAMQIDTLSDLHNNLDCSTEHDDLLEDFVVVKTMPQRSKRQSWTTNQRSHRQPSRGHGSPGQILQGPMETGSSPKSPQHPQCPSGSDQVVRGSSLGESRQSGSRTVSESSTGTRKWVYDRTEVVFGHCSYHLQNVQTALANLIAYRINLFSRRALSLLVVIGLPLVGIEERLLPVTSFLDNQLAALQTWLYDTPYKLVLCKLWAHIAKNLEKETRKMISPRNYSKVQPEILLQTIALFIKYFHRAGTGLPLHVLTQTVAKPMSWLELYTQSTPRLVSLYRHLYTYLSDKGDGRECLEERELMLKMRAELHGDRKCFSGRHFVDWFISQHTSCHDTEDTQGDDGHVSDDARPHEEETAAELAQSLLDRGIMSGVEDGSALSGVLVPSKVPTQPYPILSLDSYGGAVLPSLFRVHTKDSLTLQDEDSLSSSSEGHMAETRLTFSQTAAQDKSTVTKQSSGDLVGGRRASDDLVNEKKVSGDLDKVQFDTSCTTSDSYTATPTPTSDMSSVFQPSGRHFYRLSSLHSSLPDQTDSTDTLAGYTQSAMSDSASGPNQLHHVQELYSLYDVTPQLVVQVLTTRAPHDHAARRFLKTVGADGETAAQWEEGSSFGGCFGCGR